jgi:hypothetical protein
LTFLWRFLTFTGFTNDHYGHYALAQQMLLGDRPIRDFTDPGWPLTYLLSAAAWSVAGDHMMVEWTISVAALAVGAACTVIAAFWLSRSLAVALTTALIEVLIFPRTYSYPKILAYAVAACGLIAMAEKPTRGRVMFMAAVIAAAFLLRHDHGLYIGLAAAICLAFANYASGWRHAARQVAMLTAAAGAFLSPWLLFVTLNGGLVDYFDRALEFARAEANASNLREWPRLSRVPGQPLVALAPPDRPLLQIDWTPETTDPERAALETRYRLTLVEDSGGSRYYRAPDHSDATLRALANDPHVAGTAGFGRTTRAWWRDVLAAVSPLRLAPALHSAANADAWLFWLFWVVPVIAGGAAAWRRTQGHQSFHGEFAAVAALAALAAMLNGGVLRDVLRVRLADAVVPQVILGAWLLQLCWRERWGHRLPQLAARAAAIAMLFVSFIAVGVVAELPERIDRTGVWGGIEGVRKSATAAALWLNGPHRETPPSRVSAALRPFFAYLDRCTTRADRLIVTGEFPEVVVLSGRRFASDGVVFGAWYSSVRHQDRTLEQMKSRDPLFAVVIEGDAFRERFPIIHDYVASDYTRMADIPVDGAPPVPILVSRHRPVIRTDAETGWPCYV